MAGIGSTTYGQSQYASSGFKLGNNRLFKEYLYPREQPFWGFSTSYFEAITIAENFATHLALLWIKLVDSITASFVTKGVTIRKICSEIISLQENVIKTFIRTFQESLLLVTNFFILRRYKFVEYIRATFKRVASLKKVFKDFVESFDSGWQLISGVFSKDRIVVTSQIKQFSLRKIFTETIKVLGVVRRKLNGVLMGWTKRARPETIWGRKENISTIWTKKERRDV